MTPDVVMANITVEVQCRGRQARMFSVGDSSTLTVTCEVPAASAAYLAERLPGIAADALRRFPTLLDAIDHDRRDDDVSTTIDVDEAPSVKEVADGDVVDVDPGNDAARTPGRPPQSEVSADG